MTSSSSYSASLNRYTLPQGVGDTEEVENYRSGGFHPVHLGDTFDSGRYRIVNKLGAGGFSTVWLTRDQRENKWVALKIVDAEHSTSTAEKTALTRSIVQSSGIQQVATADEQFTFDGPNGQHLALVLPVLGPSLSELSYLFSSRLTPEFARRVAYEATKAVANLHSQGLCHGGEFISPVSLLNRLVDQSSDITTGNLLLKMSDINSYDDEGIYRLFGNPVTGELETESGEATGPEAPRYIVKNINFLSGSAELIQPIVELIDFDQSFAISSPPEKMLGTPVEFLAPEVAVGLPAGFASDIWALGCCIFRLRHGDGPFSNPYQVTSPADLMRYVIGALRREIPQEWDNVLWDYDGQPTKDTSKGESLNRLDYEVRSLKDAVYSIWEQPKDLVILTGAPIEEPSEWFEDENKPFHSSWSTMAWNPSAIQVDGDYLNGFDDTWDTTFKFLPKISESEAALLYDLLTKIFVYDATKRPKAEKILDHPWFQIDGTTT